MVYMLVPEHVYGPVLDIVQYMVYILAPKHVRMVHLLHGIHASTWACLDGPVLGIWQYGVHPST